MPLPVTVGGGAGGANGHRAAGNGPPGTQAPPSAPGAPPARAPTPGLTAEVVDELGVAGAARLPGHR